ncbi:Magnesium transporter CorA-like family protein [Melia azedarach]|uniref:Magnesium transporter CorA-like family protein n=2 Tax=Melia azedarach TaxID=155640 RepID=A0ACC1WXH9_MELAZ|nr:Magnesium transporter CorA-like family protein [Melia azedarach]KAJ4703788.1 Magnesium transporter CorA-like family protein [Melia azedarach]
MSTLVLTAVYRRNRKAIRNMLIKMSCPGCELWTDGLICAFEFVRAHKKTVNSKADSKILSDGEYSKTKVPTNRLSEASSGLERSRLHGSLSFNELRSNQNFSVEENRDSHVLQSGLEGSHWVPIGWARISELVQTGQVDGEWASQQLELMDDEDDITVADLAAPYWERPAGPIWWCHVAAGHPSVEAWLNSAQWLHPAVSLALRDESRLISERMKYLFYEVPVRVAGGLLFELLGQSAGDPFVDEDDIPIVLRSWQAKNFLITVLHVKGPVSNNNVLGITEVQELLFIGGYNLAILLDGMIGYFVSLYIGAADEIELKFVNRRNLEDMNLFGIILNQEIRRLSRQVIRVKWSLHARGGNRI